MEQLSDREIRVNTFFFFHELGLPVADAVNLAGRCSKTGYNWLNGNCKLPDSLEELLVEETRGRKPHPKLQDIWNSEIEPVLKKHPHLRSVFFVRMVVRLFPDIGHQVKRTIQRRLEKLRAPVKEGECADPLKDCMQLFKITDGSTKLSDLGIKIDGNTLAHKSLDDLLPMSDRFLSRVFKQGNDKGMRIILFFLLRGLGCSVEEAAGLVGRSRSTGYNWQDKYCKPEKTPMPKAESDLQGEAGMLDDGETRGAPTNPDIDRAWALVAVPFLKNHSAPEPWMIVHKFNEYEKDYGTAKERTIQRRFVKWQAQHGKDKRISFPRKHRPGYELQVDFTDLSALGITLRGKLVKIKLLVCRLPYSGRTYVEIVFGETIEALLCGLENAFQYFGGVPERIQTDSLSAAYGNRERKDADDMRRLFKKALKRFGVKAVRTNRARPCENGCVEKTNGHYTDAFKEELEVRGSTDFDSREDLQQWAGDINEDRNLFLDQEKFKVERKALGPLPEPHYSSLEVHYPTINNFGLFNVNGVWYSAPTRLKPRKYKGRKHKDKRRFKVRAFDDHLEAYAYGKLVAYHRLGVSKKDGGSGYVIDFRHVLSNLNDMPMALSELDYLDDLYPNPVFRRMHELAKEKLEPKKAHRHFVNLLKLAAKHNCVEELSGLLSQFLDEDTLPDVKKLGSYFEQTRKNGYVEAPKRTAKRGKEMPSNADYASMPMEYAIEMPGLERNEAVLKGVNYTVSLKIQFDEAHQQEKPDADQSIPKIHVPAVEAELPSETAPASEHTPEQLLCMNMLLVLARLTAGIAPPHVQMNAHPGNGPPSCGSSNSLQLSQSQPEWLIRMLQDESIQEAVRRMQDLFLIFAVPEPERVNPERGNMRAPEIPGQTAVLPLRIRTSTGNSPTTSSPETSGHETCSEPSGRPYSRSVQSQLEYQGVISNDKSKQPA